MIKKVVLSLATIACIGALSACSGGSSVPTSQGVQQTDQSTPAVSPPDFRKEWVSVFSNEAWPKKRCDPDHWGVMIYRQYDNSTGSISAIPDNRCS
jgi:hypothetical protein